MMVAIFETIAGLHRAPSMYATLTAMATTELPPTTEMSDGAEIDILQTIKAKLLFLNLTFCSIYIMAWYRHISGFADTPRIPTEFFVIRFLLPKNFLCFRTPLL